MSTEDNKRVAASFYELGNSGDFDGAMALLADDIRWRNIGSTAFSGTCEGKQELMEQLVGPLFAQLDAGIRSDVRLMIAEDDYVVAMVDGTARTQDGRAYNNTYCHVMRIADGRIVEMTEYFDTELAAAVLRK